MASPRPRRTSLRFVDDAPAPAPTEPVTNLRLSCREAAAVLGPSWTEKRVHAFAVDGVIPSYRVGSRIFIREDELKEWAASPRSIRAKEANLRAYIDDAIGHSEAILTALREARRQMGGE